MSDNIISLTPLHVFEIRGTTVDSTPSIFLPSQSNTTQSNRILSVFKIRPNDEGSKLLKSLEYYVDTAAVPLSAFWSFKQSQTISTFSNTTKVDEIVKRASEPKRTAIQTHTFLGRLMCTKGSILTSSNELDVKSSADFEFPRKMSISSGLGHGVWFDPLLEKALRIPPKEINNVFTANVQWMGMGDRWTTYVDNRFVDIEWEGHGAVIGGGLVLMNQYKVLAIYKPRCARWKGGGGSDEKIGSLGVVEEMNEEMMGHVVLSAVAIEEQIMRSKGFKPDSYHAEWM
ncbi:hypothetical protein K505DRAFT_360417 [Melanomma pulvis-pyrius CBS 109.77]|uniref:Uncharacterized protein n=1 Tax=Melanomma pulvis-pyrius CBS 109.77 TaxID=1314802 RepID=A0A6A6XGI4_9PLEO|nr:hypothetical protein K505DRAFT_360417 [Melanomma pulvis-pyrius CBS 109.77]